MTTEEKAKAYDEALKAARQWIKDGCTDKEKICLECCIAELRESEDERIRKFLVKHVSEWIGCIEHDLKLSSKDVESEEELAMFKADLAYLEKHKEHTLSTEETELNSIAFLEQLGYTCIPPSEWKLTEWSEEDEKIRRNLMSLLVCMRGDRIKEEIYQKYYPWLKSFPNRFALKPKIGLSEEQLEEFFKAKPVTCMSEELALHNSLYNYEEKANSPKSHRSASNSSPD